MICNEVKDGEIQKKNCNKRWRDINKIGQVYDFMYANAKKVQNGKVERHTQHIRFH